MRLHARVSLAHTIMHVQHSLIRTHTYSTRMPVSALMFRRVGGAMGLLLGMANHTHIVIAPAAARSYYSKSLFIIVFIY